MTIQLIEKYIIQAEKAEKAERKAQFRRKQEYLEKAEKAIAEALGELWDVFKPHLEKTVVDERMQSLRCHIGGEGLAELELSPFWIHYTAYKNWVSLHWSEYPSGSLPSCTPETVGTFLARQRQAYHEAREKAHKKEVDDLASQLRGYGAKNPDEADAALNSLIELEPGQKERWLKMRTGWLGWYMGQLEHQAHREQMEAIAAEYQAVYGEYLHHYLAVQGANRQALASLQVELDETSTIWQLAYGVVADEDGETYVETDRVYATTPEPDEGGWWFVFRYGKLERLRYYHPISVEGPLVFKPSEDSRSIRGEVAHRTPDHEYVNHVYFNPAVVTADEVEEMVNLTVRPYPVEPEVPAEIAGTDRAHRARRRAVEAATGAEDEF